MPFPWESIEVRAVGAMDAARVFGTDPLFMWKWSSTLSACS